MNINWEDAPEGAEGHGYLGFRKQAVWFGADWYEYLLSGRRHTFGGPNCYFKWEVSCITANPNLDEEMARAAAVTEMEEFLRNGGLTSDYNGVCKALYDAGYRKFEIVEDDV